jgi:fatty-acyl-CoA synthase
MSHPLFNEIDLSNWKVMIGGAALPEAMCRAAMQRGIDIFAGYGMSETCPVLTIAHVTEKDLSEEEEIKIRCKTGRPLPLVQLRIVDEGMNDIPADGESVGEIIVRSPWLTQGYLKDKRNSESLWKDGYLHTADIANLNENNYVKITDRMKDVIKIGGEWISSLEVEDLLAPYPGISEVAVIGLPDEKWGEKPLALVVKKADAELSEKELRKHIRGFVDKGVVSKQVVVLKVKFVDAIDKTSVGKVNKKLLREKHTTT